MGSKCSSSRYTSPVTTPDPSLLHPIPHPDNSHFINHCRPCLPVPVGGGVAHAYPLLPSVFRDPLQRPMRLTGSPESGGYQTGCRGDSVTLRSPGNTPLGQTDSLCRANPLGHPQGHVPGALPGVRFATCEPAAVIQPVIHAPLFCTFPGVRIWQKSGETRW